MPENKIYSRASTAWWLVVVLFLTALVSYSDRLILSVMVDQIRADLGLSDSQIGLLQGPAFTLVYVFAALPLGRFADSRSRKALLIAGSILWCAATVLCGLAQSGTMLLIGRLLLGVGEATLVPAAVSMVADAFAPAQRGRALSLFVMGTVIGGPLGITIGGVLLNAANNGALANLPWVGDLAAWRSTMVLVGVAGFVAPLLLMTITEPSRGAAEPTNLRAVLRHFRGDWRRLLPLYAGMALLSIGDYGLVSWVPTVMTRLYQWSSEQMGYYFGVITAAAGVAGALLGGWFADRAEQRGGTSARLALAAIAGLLAAAAAASVSMGSANLAWLGLGSWVLISTVGAMCALTIIQALIPGEFRASGMALLTFSNTLIGLGFGPTLVSFATDRVYRSDLHLDTAISTAIVPVAIGASLLFSLSRRRLAGK